MIDMKDGGPAFPVQDTVVDEKIFFAEEGHGGLHGMSLRDYFAAKAMQGWLAGYAPDAIHPAARDKAQNIAELSYAMADAMLAEREK